MTSGSCLCTLVLGLIVLLAFGSHPLWPTDLWDHVNYGQIILNSGRIPQTEPLLPLAHGVPMVNTAWGAQVLLALIFQIPDFGLTLLQLSHAILVAIALAAVGFCVLRKTGSGLIASLSMLACLAMNWQQFLTIRPQTFGVTLYCLLLIAIQRSPKQQSTLSALIFGGETMIGALLFVVWVNLHGSFATGLLLMIVVTAGAFADVACRTRSIRMAMGSRSVQGLVIMTFVCGVATLFNPYGPFLYPAVAAVGRHPNIASMFEWDPLSLNMKQGRILAGMAMLLLVVFCLSPRRRNCREIFPLAVMFVLTLWSSRMINWLAPLMAISLGTHTAAILNSWRRTHSQRTSNRHWGWTMLNIGLCGLSLLLTNFGRQVVMGKLPDDTHLLAWKTPVELGDFLKTHKSLSSGLIFCPAEWAGYLTQQSHLNLPCMVNLHVHVIPVDIWQDYLQLLSGADNTALLLDQYDIEWVITDRSRNGLLIRAMQQLPNFQLFYEDSQSLVFARKASNR